MIPAVREGAGCHEYDGRIQDLSPAGIAAGLDRLRSARRETPSEADSHDEAQLRAFESTLELRFGELEEHRRNPYVHLDNLDLAPYDRDYAPADERATARLRHLAAWPEAIEAAVSTLDQVNAPVARGLLDAVRGLGAGLGAPGGGSDEGRGDAEARACTERALAALPLLVEHLTRAAEHGDPDPAIGAQAL
ncbi:MAG: DUF885 family protein, partial [Acidimicrobiales bacterium]